jgi:2-polyprenyl-3-methyl-5-hydroxy-6-metoxy-1,4-benzoquinol methylase
MNEQRLAWNLHIEATNEQFDTEEISLGPWTSYSMLHDPKHMAFVLSRYKFCAKLLTGKNLVLEVGCGDAFGAPIIAQSVSELHCIDWDRRNIDGNKRRLEKIKNIKFLTHDITDGSIGTKYDAIFNIDVIEHLEPEYENKFLKGMLDSLNRKGVLIIGTPNKTASQYATFRSDHQHINLKTADSLKSLLDQHFDNTFIFSMNDEVMHTGYFPMSHYLFAVGVGIKD